MNKIILSKEKEQSLLKKRPGALTSSEKRRAGKLSSGQKRVAGRRNHYSEEEKMKAACTFAVTGNSRRTAEITKISEGTIRNWKQTEWWNEIQASIIREQDEELTSDLTKLVNKAVGEINDRLDKGDYVYNAKEDRLIRKPVNAKDLAIVAAITVDKRQLLRGQPTSRVEKVSTDERLKNLAEHFKKFVNAKEVVQVEGELQDAIEEREIQESN